MAANSHRLYILLLYFFTQLYDCHCATCQDFVHPRTGISDCSRYAHLCENDLYRQVMTEQCPLTCKRCSIQTTCRDLVDYRTGVSTCPRNQRLCFNVLYKKLMEEQCPLTCGYCT